MKSFLQRKFQKNQGVCHLAHGSAFGSCVFCCYFFGVRGFDVDSLAKHVESWSFHVPVWFTGIMTLLGSFERKHVVRVKDIPRNWWIVSFTESFSSEPVNRNFPMGRLIF